MTQDYFVAISIITPVYNTGNFLLETFNCLTKQTFTNYEWVIINDGSDDGLTLKVLEDICIKGNRIKIIHHCANKGLPASRNTGIKNSGSPYLFFLDGDDLIDATFLEKAYLVISQHPQIAFVNSYVIGFGAQQYKWTGGFHEKKLFLKENRNTSCFMARKEVFNHISFDETMIDGCEDWDFWLHAAAKGFWGYTIPEFLFYYRRKSANKWASLNKRSLEEIHQRLYDKYAGKLTKDFPNATFSKYSFGEVVPFIDEVISINSGGDKRLLCIFPWLQIGGADQFNFNLLEGLKTKGWSITIITTLKDGHAWEEKFRSITTDIFHIANLGTTFHYPIMLDYLIASRNVKLIFLSNSMYGYYALPFLKSRFPQMPIVDYLHCEDVGWYNGGYPYFSGKFSAFLDRTFTTSKALRQDCISHGSLPERTEVCYINVDTVKIKRDIQNRESIRLQMGLEKGVVIILYVARLTKQKQPEVLMQTLLKINKKFSNFHCIIIGDGPDRQIVENVLRGKSIEKRVTYLGNQPNEVVLQYMDAADIFFLPSLYEGIALSIYEAMAKSLAIIGADVGGQRELVSPDCGYLVRQESPKIDANSYADVFSDLLVKPAIIKEIGMNARKRVQQYFHLSSMIQQLDDCFSNISVDKTVTKEAVTSTYMLVLNRMMNLEELNQKLLEKADSRVLKLIFKYKKPYRKAREIYHKIKNILNKKN